MKHFIVIFREPDGRSTGHSKPETEKHQEDWKIWMGKWTAKGKYKGGSSLTLNGKMIQSADKKIVNDIHKVGTEIVGGFLLLDADDLSEATQIAASCPIFDFGGYAEIREMQN